MSQAPSEFRRDPYSGEWVTIAGARQSRPALPETCPFCVGGLEAPEAYSVKAFTNRWPVMRPMAQVVSEGEDPSGRSPAAIIDELRTPPNVAVLRRDAGAPVETAPAVGAAEVLLYTPEHEGSLGGLPADQLTRVWNLWKERTAELSARDEIASVLVFENRGEEVGVTIHHPHCQIYAFPFIPPRQRSEFALAKTRSDAGQACATCELISAETNGPRVLLETEHLFAYVPFASAWPYAAHITTKRHLGSILEIDPPTSTEQGDALEGEEFRTVLGRVLRAGDRIFDRPLPTMMALLQRPFDGSDPEALWHFRVEVVSPLRKHDTLRYVAAAEVSSGTYANPVTPENAAQQWRAALDEEE